MTPSAARSHCEAQAVASELPLPARGEREERWNGRRAPAGYTFLELVIVTAILAILAAIALPTGHFAVRRAKETELRQALRTLRNAIDEHKRYADAGLIRVETGTDGYPPELEVLVEGVEVVGGPDQEIRFLRRIPVDPMTGRAEWGLRSYQDPPDATSWGGEDVYDVYSLSQAESLSGERYSEW